MTRSYIRPSSKPQRTSCSPNTFEAATIVIFCNMIVIYSAIFCCILLYSVIFCYIQLYSATVVHHHHHHHHHHNDLKEDSMHISWFSPHLLWLPIRFKSLHKELTKYSPSDSEASKLIRIQREIMMMNEIEDCLHEDEERLDGGSWILNHNVPGWSKRSLSSSS